MPEISLLVEGGKATAGPPLGPSLAPLGVNIGAIVAEINSKTKSFSGIKVPVKVLVDSATKKFEIEIGSPPTSSLIRKELNIPKGSGDQKVSVGNMTLAQVRKIAEMKKASVMSTNLEKTENEVIGTANSMGVKVEGLSGKNFLRKRRGLEIEEEFTVEEEGTPAPKETKAKETKEEENEDV